MGGYFTGSPDPSIAALTFNQFGGFVRYNGDSLGKVMNRVTSVGDARSEIVEISRRYVERSQGSNSGRPGGERGTGAFRRQKCWDVVGHSFVRRGGDLLRSVSSEMTWGRASSRCCCARVGRESNHGVDVAHRRPRVAGAAWNDRKSGPVDGPSIA